MINGLINRIFYQSCNSVEGPARKHCISFDYGELRRMGSVRSRRCSRHAGLEESAAATQGFGNHACDAEIMRTLLEPESPYRHARTQLLCIEFREQFFQVFQTN